MATILQFRRGNNEIATSIKCMEGELYVNLDKNNGRGMLVVHDGINDGGIDVSPFQLKSTKVYLSNTTHSLIIGEDGDFDNGIFKLHLSGSLQIKGGINNSVSGGTISSETDNNLGSNCEVVGIYSSILSGRNHTIDSNYSCVLFGANNITTGNYSLSLGNLATAAHNGSIVFADHTNIPIISDEDRQFKIQHNVRIMGNLIVDGGITFGGLSSDRKPVEIPNNIITTFTTLYEYIPGSLDVYVNGVLQEKDSHYVENEDYHSYTFLFTPLTGESVQHKYWINV